MSSASCGILSTALNSDSVAGSSVVNKKALLLDSRATAVLTSTSSAAVVEEAATTSVEVKVLLLLGSPWLPELRNVGAAAAFVSSPVRSSL